MRSDIISLSKEGIHTWKCVRERDIRAQSKPNLSIKIACQPSFILVTLHPSCFPKSAVNCEEENVLDVLGRVAFNLLTAPDFSSIWNIAKG